MDVADSIKYIIMSGFGGKTNEITDIEQVVIEQVAS